MGFYPPSLTWWNDGGRSLRIWGCMAAMVLGCNAQTLGSQVSAVETVELTISVTDGFSGPAWSNTYAIDVAKRTVTYTWADVSETATTEPVPHVKSAVATNAQMQALVAAIQATEWRPTTDCEELAVDGAPWPPGLDVHGGGKSFHVEATDSPCTPSDHGASGDVITCEAFAVVEAKVHAILPGGALAGCESYW